MTLLLATVFIVCGAAAYAQTTFTPSPGIECLENADCGDPERRCCSITPLLGKRQPASVTITEVGGALYPYVHYCLPYKALDAPWCDLNLQYSPDSSNYFGLCPCGPDLRCTPTEDLDPAWYPRDRYGKCTSA